MGSDSAPLKVSTTDSSADMKATVGLFGTVIPAYSAGNLIQHRFKLIGVFILREAPGDTGILSIPDKAGNVARRDSSHRRRYSFYHE